jgi:hypothetical protein
MMLVPGCKMCWKSTDIGGDYRFSPLRQYLFCSQLKPSDWTLHALPAPAHPSFRLITALRLYHLVPASTTHVQNPAEVLQLWNDTLAGRRPLVSRENENAWRATLLEMCKRIRERASVGVLKVEGIEQGGPDWVRWIKEAIILLWREEEAVARAVEDSILSGEEY